MLKRIRPRRGQPPRPPDRWRSALRRASAVGADIAKTSLIALKESADTFPPLKSAAGGVLAVWDIAERAKASKKKAKAIAARCLDILEALVDAVPDPSRISPEMQADIRKFTCLLRDICQVMELLQGQTRMSLLRRLNRNEDELDSFRQRLDELYQIFMLSSALRTEIKLLEIRHDVAAASIKLDLLDHGQLYISSLLTVSIGLF